MRRFFSPFFVIYDEFFCDRRVDCALILVYINHCRLLNILGAKPEDEIVLKFWMTGLNKQYRSHLLTCSSAGASSWPSLTNSLSLEVLQSCSDKLVPSLQRLRILIDYDLLGHKNDWPLCALRELFLRLLLRLPSNRQMVQISNWRDQFPLPSRHNWIFRITPAVSDIVLTVPLFPRRLWSERPSFSVSRSVLFAQENDFWTEKEISPSVCNSRVHNHKKTIIK